ncbi:IS1634 family transposase [Sporolactobacillus terrae]|uniref:IS1634 family transposase n=1 Tax=Sporolactobacillus terrae TaxID=269673 RepID=UPI0004912F74|nr:IS1634 family transposase [Sporolactobacillus terrae]UAK16754.1 IS1634 family transposase [Sporolactobacillus terrae]
MAIIRQKDKRSGLTYAYESESYWDKEKKQPRSRRKLIGRVDEKTGKIIPTDGRGKRRRQTSEEKPQRGPTPAAEAKRVFYGATYLLDQIGEQLGLTEDLKTCFPRHYQQILSLAYYMILEHPNPLTRFEKWDHLHKHPYGKNVTSQRSSIVFSSISEAGKNQFFSRRKQRCHEDEYWAYDTTSISSYSEVLKQVAYGKNKEDDRLPQINLALIFGETSGLPFYYRKLAGNIPDVKTVLNLLGDFKTLGFEKVKLVMDRGFYSATNINALMKEHLKFLIAVRPSLSWVRHELDQVYDALDTFENLDEQYDLYALTVRTDWDYTQDRPYKGDTLKEKRRVYLHLYYNVDQAAEDQKKFDRKLMRHHQELKNGQRVPEHEAFYKKYFTVKSTPKRGAQITVNHQMVEKAKRYYGYFSLLSNEKMDAIQALELYWGKDPIEKCFGDIKERLNLRRMLVSSEAMLDGKLFVSFVGLILLAQIKKKMQAQKLFKDYTIQSLFDKLDVIEAFESPGQALKVGEILTAQKKIYEALGVPLPSDV